MKTIRKYPFTEIVCTSGENAAVACELGYPAFAAVSLTIHTKLFHKVLRASIKNLEGMSEP